MRRLSHRGRKNSLRASTPLVENLEGRLLLSAAPAGWTAVPQVIQRPFAAADVASLATGSNPQLLPTVSTSYTPAQIRHAYGIDQLSLDGTGQTIGIVDAYDMTSAAVTSDLAAFDTAYGLPTANLTVVTPSGSNPTLNPGWNLEIDLDVEWAHAIAPGAKIVLVEAATTFGSDLYGAVNTAVQMGANQVSMSWGGGEYFGESTDSNTYFNHPGVTFLASSGDTASQVLFPAASPYVTGVGGTTLALDSSGNIFTEAAWSSGGGGPSTMASLPSFQSGFFNSSKRGTPDVAYDADPNSGVDIIFNGGATSVGGTSAGAPQWAGLVALANQGRVAAGKSTLGTGQTFGTNSVLYQLAGGTSYTNTGGDFNDITTGSNGHAATAGYDLATGLGSPVANRLIPDLIGPAKVGSAPAVGDFSFETVPVAANNYVYDPTGSAWSYASFAGVSGLSSALTGNGPAPQGSQVAILQVYGSMTQTIPNWAAGTYSISLYAAQSAAMTWSNEDFAVLVDGNVVGTFDPSGAKFQAFTTSSFTVTAGSHSIELLGLDSVNGYNTAVIDDITVAAVTPPPTVGDYSFETVPVAANNYVYDPTGSAWSYASFAGVSGLGSALTGNGPAPQGSQVAILQVYGSMTQTIPNWAAGTYSISLYAAQSAAMTWSNEDFAVLVDGNVVGTFDPSGAKFQAFTTSSFTVTAGSHSIELLGLDSVNGYNTAVIDDITIAASTGSGSGAPGLPSAGDSSFETVPVAANSYITDPTGSAWTFVGQSGVSGINSAVAGNGPAPQGSQVGFIQNKGMLIQSIANWAAGSYTISLDAAQGANQAGSAEDFEVQVDGNLVVVGYSLSVFKPSGTTYQAFATPKFSVTGGSHVIKILGVDSAGGSNTVVFDNFTIASA